MAQRIIECVEQDKRLQAVSVFLFRNIVDDGTADYFTVAQSRSHEIERMEVVLGLRPQDDAEYRHAEGKKLRAAIIAYEGLEQLEQGGRYSDGNTHLFIEQFLSEDSGSIEAGKHSSVELVKIVRMYFDEVNSMFGRYRVKNYDEAKVRAVLDELK